MDKHCPSCAQIDQNGLFTAPGRERAPAETVAGRRGCLPELPEGPQDHSDAAIRRRTTLTINTWIATGIAAIRGVAGLILIPEVPHIGVINLFSAAVFVATTDVLEIRPAGRRDDIRRRRVRPTVLVCSRLWTDGELQFYFFVGAALIILVRGGAHLVIATALSAPGGGSGGGAEMARPTSHRGYSESAVRTSLGATVGAASLMMLIVAESAMRRIDPAESALAGEIARSEALIANVLPESAATGPKARDGSIIAAGPVLAGVVDSRARSSATRGADGANGESRMGRTDVERRIQGPQDVPDRINAHIWTGERGEVEVKGKGAHAHLVPRRPQAGRTHRHHTL